VVPAGGAHGELALAVHVIGCERDQGVEAEQRGCRSRDRPVRPLALRLNANVAPCRGMAHIRGAPRHPQTQGKIERWHQTLKNRILLEEPLPARRTQGARRARRPHATT
jgi:transposase InsO family protein